MNFSKETSAPPILILQIKHSIKTTHNAHPKIYIKNIQQTKNYASGCMTKFHQIMRILFHVLCRCCTVFFFVIVGIYSIRMLVETRTDRKEIIDTIDIVMSTSYTLYSLSTRSYRKPKPFGKHIVVAFCCDYNSVAGCRRKYNLTNILFFAVSKSNASFLFCIERNSFSGTLNVDVVFFSLLWYSV